VIGLISSSEADIWAAYRVVKGFELAHVLVNWVQLTVSCSVSESSLALEIFVLGE